MLGLKGNNIFKKDKYRLDYRLYAYTFPTHFWGIGFDKGKRDENDTEYRRIKFDAMMRFLFKIAPRLYMGPTANFQFAQAQDIDPSGCRFLKDKTTRTQSLGLTLTYDSRDFILNANRGFFLQLDQTFAPRFLANSYCFSATDVTASTYTRIWKGRHFGNGIPFPFHLRETGMEHDERRRIEQQASWILRRTIPRQKHCRTASGAPPAYCRAPRHSPLGRRRRGVSRFPVNEMGKKFCPTLASVIDGNSKNA